MLNSFWGKLGEKLLKKATETITSPAHLFGLVSNTLNDIRAVRICSEEVIEVDYLNLNEN